MTKKLLLYLVKIFYLFIYTIILLDSYRLFYINFFYFYILLISNDNFEYNYQNILNKNLIQCIFAN